MTYIGHEQVPVQPSRHMPHDYTWWYNTLQCETTRSMQHCAIRLVAH